MTDQLGLFYKERGMAIVETAEAIHSDWIERADDAIRELAGTRFAFTGEPIPFTAEDVRARVGPPAHPNSMGARMNAAAKRGLIVKAGTVKASRPERHANEMRLWVGR